jgi:hypothetical protein
VTRRQSASAHVNALRLQRPIASTGAYCIERAARGRSLNWRKLSAGRKTAAQEMKCPTRTPRFETECATAQAREQLQIEGPVVA